MWCGTNLGAGARQKHRIIKFYSLHFDSNMSEMSNRLVWLNFLNCIVAIRCVFGSRPDSLGTGSRSFLRCCENARVKVKGDVAFEVTWNANWNTSQLTQAVMRLRQTSYSQIDQMPKQLRCCHICWKWLLDCTYWHQNIARNLLLWLVQARRHQTGHFTVPFVLRGYLHKLWFSTTEKWILHDFFDIDMWQVFSVPRMYMLYNLFENLMLLYTSGLLWENNHCTVSYALSANMWPG